MNHADIVKDLIQSEQKHFMEKTIERLSEIDDYDHFLQEIALIANYTEYRKNLYRDHISKIWYKQLHSINSEVDTYDNKLNIDNIKDGLEFAILNDIGNLITDKHLSFIEAWEEIREGIECGEYSVMKYINSISW